MATPERTHNNGFHADCDRSTCGFWIERARRNRCIKGTPESAYTHCYCDSCARAAAAAWMELMERVAADEITLAEAQRLSVLDPR